MFWLPRERTIITGDCMYGPSVQVWAEEIETPQILEAWRNVLDLIEGLEPVKIIPGHKSSHDQLDKTRDLQYNRDYLKLFADKITYAAQTPEVKEVRARHSRDGRPLTHVATTSCTARSRAPSQTPRTTSTSSLAISPISSARAAKSGKRTSTTTLVLARLQASMAMSSATPPS